MQTFKNDIPNDEIKSVQDGLIVLKNKSTINCITGNKASKNTRGKRSAAIHPYYEPWEYVDPKVINEVLEPFLVKQTFWQKLFKRKVIKGVKTMLICGNKHGDGGRNRPRP